MTPREREQWLIRIGRGTLLSLVGLWGFVILMTLVQLEFYFINLIVLGHADSWLLGPVTNAQLPNWIAFIYVSLIGWCLTQVTAVVLHKITKRIIKFLKQYEIRRKPKK